MGDHTKMLRLGDRHWSFVVGHWSQRDEGAQVSARIWVESVIYLADGGKMLRFDAHLPAASSTWPVRTGVFGCQIAEVGAKALYPMGCFGGVEMRTVRNDKHLRAAKNLSIFWVGWGRWGI